MHDDAALAVSFTARTERYSDDDDRWLLQVAELNRTLREETGAAVRPDAAAPGTKGAVDQLILALGSAGAFTTTIEMLRVWLSRDRTRSVEARWTDGDGVMQCVSLSADMADSKTLAPLVAAVAQRIGATP